ncbi:MAG: MBL fold metallo-hydrolase [Bacteroidota bacterium]|nr:MBL fold metallo-hydrolase [Bacteroidota bacterium]
MKLKFIGATETVTGSKHLVITEKGAQILLDCGLYQGMGHETNEMNAHLGLNPLHIDAVILSHAHIDHSGNLPYLVRQGFRGKIYCTRATAEVAEILLMDSAHIHEADIYYINKVRERRGQKPLKPMYTEMDVQKTVEMFHPLDYHTDFAINDEISFSFTDAGHILGSAAVNITAKENGKITKLTFTGDIGRYTDMLMKDPEPFPQADYIICESTYGDRLHDKTAAAEMHLLDVVRRTCVEKKGKLIIPAFSLGRTQEIVFVLDKLKNADLLPANLKVFVDSPLSVSATDITRKYVHNLNDNLQEYIKKDPDPFGFQGLVYIQKREDSMRLNEYNHPCIIISASGMMEAGRVKHHIAHNISNPKNTILAVGYCTPSSLGGKLVSGEKNVNIFGENFQVLADVESIHSYSAHGDYEEMLKFLNCQNKKEVKKVFLVHGEQNTKKVWRETLVKEGFGRVEIPVKGEIFEL